MNTDDDSPRRTTAMPNLQAGVDLNLIDSNSSRELLRSALDAKPVWAFLARKHRTAESRM
jgi:hypothetical protein